MTATPSNALAARAAGRYQISTDPSALARHNPEQPICTHNHEEASHAAQRRVFRRGARHARLWLVSPALALIAVGTIFTTIGVVRHVLSWRK
jgi:hypothetical protein